MANYQPPQTGSSRVSSCGNYIYLPNGQKFKRTVLPSVAEKKKEEFDVEDELEQLDAEMRGDTAE